MAQKPQQVTEEAAWPSNYFNYFTEVEERFQKARGTGCFSCRRSIGRWWKRGRTAASRSKQRCAASTQPSRNGARKKKRGQNVNSVAYCAQAVMVEAQAMAGVAPARDAKESAAPFTLRSA